MSLYGFSVGFKLPHNVPRVNEGAHINAPSVPETKMKIRMRNVTQNTNRALSFNPMLAAALYICL